MNKLNMSQLENTESILNNVFKIKTK